MIEADRQAHEFDSNAPPMEDGTIDAGELTEGDDRERLCTLIANSTLIENTLIMSQIESTSSRFDDQPYSRRDEATDEQFQMRIMAIGRYINVAIFSCGTVSPIELDPVAISPQ